ncbi:hypothetical protein BaRGS_00022963 [Batillaria attramentaria]|uniref:C2H2-type domain-containing protein n=1 Tax=Batillaria attramentaria TaxID=370345 RepID=A0ABD0KFX6_9CAEN
MAANTEKSSDSDVAMDADGDPTYVPDSSSSDSEASVSYPMLVAARVSADDACTDPAGENCAHAVPACEDGKHSDIKGLTYSETITVGERTVPKPQKHVCLFCHKPQSRLSRHLGSQHGGEKALVPYLNARKGDEKKRELAKLRNAGDHQHNIGVLRNKEGTMVVKRRKRQDCTVDIDNFVTCPNCFGLFQKKDLYRHKCAEAQREHGPRRELARRGKLLLPVDGEEQDSERFLSFLHTMHGDHISIVAKNDRLIRALAKRQVKRHGFDKDRFGHIRNKVRELARLLLKLREVSRLPNGTLKDFLKPGMFGAIVESTKQVAGYCENEYIFKTPSLASKLGHSLKTCAEMLEAEGIENKDEQLVEDVRGYLKLHQMRWNEEISAHASRSLTHLKKSQGVKRIPLTKDVATLATHLNNLASESSKNLQKAIESKEIKEAWNSLSEITLTQIILFNRRRSGEASKLKLEDLNQQPTHDSDVLESLSDFEKKLCKRLSRIEIFGKRGRLVPILLAGKLKAALDLLVEKREAAGISPLNKFVFSLKVT